ncbi:MAG: glycosyltransferase family 2 protein [Planctomycetota bacterium]
MTPEVSVVIPTYNRSPYVGSAIASVLAQDRRDFELIVVDDGSTDDTAAELSEWVGRDPRVQVCANNGSHGPAGARNAGIALARADWVAFLDSDDRWEPRTLERLLAAVKSDTVLVSGDFRMTGDDGPDLTMQQKLLETMIPWWERDPLAREAIDCARLRANIHCCAEPELLLGMAVGGLLWLGTSSTMARRRDVVAAGGFDARLLRTEDFDLWLRLMNRGTVVYVDHVLANCDVGGRGAGLGPRYEGYERPVHTAYDEERWHLRFLRALAGCDKLNLAQRRFLTVRVAAARRRCGYAALGARPAAAAWHYAVTLLSSRQQRTQLRAEGRAYFRKPW